MQKTIGWTVTALGVMAVAWSAQDVIDPCRVETVEFSDGRLVKGLNGDLPLCNTYFNTVQCEGSDAFVDCYIMPGENACTGDCSGYLCDGTNNASYCNAHWAPAWNALNCLNGPMNCGSQVQSIGDCTTRLVWDPHEQIFVMMCDCEPWITTAEPCPDTHIEEFDDCEGDPIIGFYCPRSPDSRWLEGMRIREAQLLALVH